jgi:stage V sporulation protein G
VEITEIRIKLMDDKGNNNERLQAFCSVTFDDMFVVRDLKIIEGAKGSFVAMPSRKLTDRCPECGCKNHLRARFCNQCGRKLPEERAPRDQDGRAKLHADIAHPINSSCREFMQSAITKAFQEELVRSKQPGYICRYDEIDAGEEESYEQVIGGLHGHGENVRKHKAHEPHGGHAAWNGGAEQPASMASAGRDEEREERSFGAGILEQ